LGIAAELKAKVKQRKFTVSTVSRFEDGASAFNTTEIVNLFHWHFAHNFVFVIGRTGC